MCLSQLLYWFSEKVTTLSVRYTYANIIMLNLTDDSINMLLIDSLLSIYLLYYIILLY